MGIALTIAIPVGPKENHRKWLGGCIQSIDEQLENKYDEIILVVEHQELPDYVYVPQNATHPHSRIIDIPTRLGVAAMVNLSVVFSKHEHVLLMNSDDKLLPGALDSVRAAWERHKDPQGWYYLNTLYSDGREQKSPSGVAMVCRSHFLEIGGYPPESAVGFPDWMFLSLMQARGLITPYPVSDQCLHWHRVHDEQETIFRQNNWKDAANLVHDTLQRTWKL